VQAKIKRVIHLGFEVRIELEMPDGETARAQLTRAQTQQLELAEGGTVYVNPPAGAVLGTTSAAEIVPGTEAAALSS
jgi:sulfate transport system ATP-binding protein